MLLIYGRVYFTHVHLIRVYIHRVWMAASIWHDTTNLKTNYGFRSGLILTLIEPSPNLQYDINIRKIYKTAITVSKFIKNI